MKLFYTLLFTLLFFVGFAQNELKIGFELKQKLETIKTTASHTQDQQIPILIEGEAVEVERAVAQMNGRVQYSVGNEFTSATLPINKISALTDFRSVQRISGGDIGLPLNDSVRINNNVLPLHNGTNGLDRPYKGKGVIVGILDTGVDYRHPDFSDENGNSRILRIWDQLLEGREPRGFAYGYECDAESIRNRTCPSIDTSYRNITHGTHVAGVATAFDQDFNGKYTGMAPEANVVAVALDFDNFKQSVVDGAKYIFDLADELGMPAVINLSAGNYFASRTGRDAATRALEVLINEKPGRSFVISAGNGQRFGIHVPFEVNQDPHFTYVKYHRSRSNPGFKFVLQGAENELNGVNLQFQLDQTNYQPLAQSTLINISDFHRDGNNFGTYIQELKNSDNEVIGQLQIEPVLYEEEYILYCSVIESSSSYLLRFSATGEGRFDLYSNTTSGASQILRKSQVRTTHPDYDYYLESDDQQSIIGGFAVSDDVIMVGNYNNSIQWVNHSGQITHYTNLENESIDPNSSTGPTRDGRLKPDIASTGSYSATAFGLNQWNFLIERGWVNRLSPDGIHVFDGGTSNASPAVAGGIALLFERYPTMTAKEIKQTILQNAKEDQYTRTVPNMTWGHGKFNAFQSFTNIYKEGCTNSNADNYDPDATVSLDNCIISGCMDPNSLNYNPEANKEDGSCILPNYGQDVHLSVFPNPIDEDGLITIATNRTYKTMHLNLYNSIGQLVWQKQFADNINFISVNTAELGLANDTYYLQLLLDDEEVASRSFVKH